MVGIDWLAGLPLTSASEDILYRPMLLVCACAHVIRVSFVNERRARLLDEARVDDRRRVRHLLDDAELQQQLARLLLEVLQLAVEELGVLLAVGPAEIS